MKLTLLLLWSLGSVPLHELYANSQPGNPAPAAAPYQAYPNPAPGYAGNPGYGAQPGSQFNEFSSPCGDCYGGAGGYGGGGGYGRRCRSCCSDSTCDMYQHYPYAPDNHGYYYFAPYNYSMVWKHQQWITTIGGDPRNPYSRAMFIPVYEQFENTVYEPDHKPSQALETLPANSRRLPELESLIRKSEGDAPAPLPPADPTPESPKPEVPAAAELNAPNPAADAVPEPVAIPEIENN